MHEVNQALNEVRDLYQKVLGQPAPDIKPGSYVSFPQGVDPLAHTILEVNQLKQFSTQLAAAPAPATWMPPTDTFATAEDYIFQLEIPGVDRETLKVFVADGQCVIRGERRPPEGHPDLRPLSLERNWGPFERRFLLPAGSRADKISARCDNGMLEVRLPLEASEEKKIEVVA